MISCLHRSLWIFLHSSPTKETIRVLDKFVCFKYSGQTSSLNLTSFSYFVGEKNVQQLGTLLQASRVYVWSNIVGACLIKHKALGSSEVKRLSICTSLWMEPTWTPFRLRFIQVECIKTRKNNLRKTSETNFTQSSRAHYIERRSNIGFPASR